MAKHSICIAVKEKLVKDSGVAEEIAYDNIVLKLLTKSRARGEYSRSKCKMLTHFVQWFFPLILKKKKNSKK